MTIELLKLHDRGELIQGRCLMLRAIYRVLRVAYGAGSPAAEQADAQAELAVMLGGTQPHTACARAFCRLFISNPAAARAVYEEALRLLSRTRT